MKEFTAKQLDTKQQIEKLQVKLLSRSGEVAGEIGDFQYFIKSAISAKLHAFTSNEYPSNKPNLEDFENIMFNVDMLNDMLECMNEIQYLGMDFYK